MWSLESAFSSITGLIVGSTGLFVDSDAGFFPSVATDTLDLPLTQEQKQLKHRFINLAVN